MRKSALILTFLSLLPFCQARTITVDDNAPADFNNIQAAINAFVEGDSIVVADGNYTGTGNRDIINSADPCVKNLIIRSANGPQNCIINCAGTAAKPYRAFYFEYTSKKTNIIINGFTMINGYAPTAPNQGSGFGGAVCFNDRYISLAISNCIFKNNKCQASGGAIYIGAGTFKITDCDFIGNSALSIISDGGGICCRIKPDSNDYLNPVFEDCTFTGNTAYAGGGICVINSSTTLTNCIFKQNSAIEGGAVYNSLWMYNCSVVYKNCIFSKNSTTKYSGGAVVNYLGTQTLSNCLFTENTAKQNGGAIYNRGEGQYNIINCTFFGNFAASNGGGIQGDKAKFTIINNCILWNNKDIDGIDRSAQLFLSPLYINYCCVQGWTDGLPGVGNINLNPLFVDPDNINPNNRNYHLKATSPCINTADPNYIAEPNETDLGGWPRVIGGRIDMGAYEFNHGPFANSGPDQAVYAYIDNIADVNLDGSDSNDPDGDALTYKWTWTIDSNTYEANSVNPIIELPVGMHTIELIVNDGIVNSQPDYVDVNVIGPVKAGLEILPQAINVASHGRWIWVYMVLPKGCNEKDINKNQQLVMEPLGVESKSMNVFTIFRRYVCITAAFDRDEVCDNIRTGRQKISVVGQFKTGQYFFGSDIIKVIGKKK